VTSTATRVATWSTLPDRQPTMARVAAVDLVVVRIGDRVSVLYGRCPHRGAPMGDAALVGANLVCAAHGWDFRWDTGVSDKDPSDCLHAFRCWIDHEQDAVCVDRAEVEQWLTQQPQTFHVDEYLGA
jgi:nitrite reductase/ring-hydroxylating ferredoxin subunit